MFLGGPDVLRNSKECIKQMPVNRSEYLHSLFVHVHGNPRMLLLFFIAAPGGAYS